MKRLFVLMGVLAGCGSSAFAKSGPEVTCIASDGLELRLPDPSSFFMQPIALSNGYDPGFLKNLIKRHPGHQTTDSSLRLNVSFGSCQLVDDSKLTCEARSFGNATYRYSFDHDSVTVSTRVSGHLSLELTKDAQGIYQLDFTITNPEIGEDHSLHIKKTFGPKNDPLVSSLTPWSPGCLITN